MQHLFNRKTDSFFGSLRYLGYLLLPAGLVVASSAWWWPNADKVQLLSVGILLFVLGVLFKFTYHGFQIDFKRRRVREYLSMFGLKTGRWAPLPAFERVVLTSNLGPVPDHDHEHQHDHNPAPLVTWYTLGLYSQSEEADYELRTDSSEDALSTLQLLAERLRIVAEDKTRPLDPFSR